MKITISETAKSELKKLTKDTEKVAKIILAGARCIVGTPLLSLAFEEKKEDDALVIVEGIKVAYNRDLENLLEKANIDFEEEGFQRGFSVRVLT